MFFVFYILVFMIFQLSKTNSFSVKREINQDEQSLTGNEKTFNIEGNLKTLEKINSKQRKDQDNSFIFLVTGDKLNNGSNASPYLFHILQNLTQTKSPNLKYNVFDKMLSDELLSIKQHVYDKDARYVSGRTASKSNVTPTLEIKQKWPVMELLSKLNKHKEIDEYVTQGTGNDVVDDFELDYSETNELGTTEISTYMEKQNNTLSEAEVIKAEEIRQELVENMKCRKSIQKVIGLRSLYPNTDERQLKNRRCSCDNKSSATCGPQVAGSTYKCTRCSHGMESPCDSACAQTSKPWPLTTCSHSSTCIPILSSSSGDSCSKCSRAACTSTGCSTQVSYSVFPFYMPFQYPIQTPNPMAYYFTTELEDYGFTGKSKHHSTKRHKVDYYYYDDNSEEDDYLEHSIKKETRSPVKESCRDVVLKIDYIDKVQKRPNELCDGVYDSSKNKFVNEIVQDLKIYYPEAVVKDCYCKSSSVRSTLSFYFILVVFYRTIYIFKC